MRLVVFLFALALAATAAAGVRPLSSKDVSLMLRSGYSSDDVLREIAQRRVTDGPDPATKKSLVDFGASPRLLSALESGEFRVDAATAERTREEETKTSAAQEAEAEKTFRHATEVLKEQRSRPVVRPSLGGSLVSLLKDKLVRCHDGTIQTADSSALESKKLVAFYYSAHWCPPCRKFTPQLVDYYNRVAAEHPEFELIFVSYDKSRFNWETYMRDTKMPWLAIDFDQLGELRPVETTRRRKHPVASRGRRPEPGGGEQLRRPELRRPAKRARCLGQNFRARSADRAGPVVVRRGSSPRKFGASPQRRLLPAHAGLAPSARGKNGGCAG